MEDSNKKAHHTDMYMSDDLILRRGQSFKVMMEFSDTLKDWDSIVFKVQTGPPDAQSDKLSVEFDLSNSWTSGMWCAVLESSLGNSLQIIMCSPANAIIGRYNLSVSVTITGEISIYPLGSFMLIFNPWCLEDEVYMANEEERKEYVLNDHGIIFMGNEKHIAPLGWNYGQFENNIVNICMDLMDRNLNYHMDPVSDCSQRNSPIYVGRIVSAMINSNDDYGVLEGKWEQDFSDGVDPNSWNGSVEILWSWQRDGYKSVKYGQCWVFAAVMCTVMRSLGLPTRVITNFNSAHNTDEHMNVDMYYDTEGKFLEIHDDSIWNFHVWNECWFTRKDIGHYYNGWQVLDSTPQEESEGIYCCGPTSVIAVREGDVNLLYDCPFVFAEVNSDRDIWVVHEDGSKEKAYSDSKYVGQSISTKAIGSNDRVDVTHTYKYPEGSRKEREVYEKACRNMLLYRSPPERTNESSDSNTSENIARNEQPTQPPRPVTHPPPSSHIGNTLPTIPETNVLPPMPARNSMPSLLERNALPSVDGRNSPPTSERNVIPPNAGRNVIPSMPGRNVLPPEPERAPERNSVNPIPGRNVLPAPERNSVNPIPGRSSLPPAPERNSGNPMPGRNVLPAPERNSGNPMPGRNVLPAAPERNSLSPVLGRRVLPPTPESNSLSPVLGRRVLPPTPESNSLSPVLGRRVLPTTPERNSLSPVPGRNVLPPAPERNSLNPMPGRNVTPAIPERTPQPPVPGRNAFRETPTERDAEVPDVTGKFKILSPLVVGEDINLLLLLRNMTTFHRPVKVNLSASCVMYTGRRVADIYSDQTSVVVSPSRDAHIPLQISYSQYQKCLRNGNMIQVVALCELPFGQKVVVTKNLVLDNPPLHIKVIGKAVLHETITLEIRFTNPLSVPVKDCALLVEGGGLVERVLTAVVPFLKPREKIRFKVELTPYRAGDKQLIVNFRCKHFSIKGYKLLTVATA